MKAGKSKAKGSAFEREVAKMLTLWASGQSKEYWFWRSPSSGAVSTITAGNGEISGDIIAIKPEGTFLTGIYSIEIKTGYPNSSFHKLLKGLKNDELCDFWTQCCLDADRAKKKPMLIYKKKQYNTLIGISGINDALSEIPHISLNFGERGLPSCNFFDIIQFLDIVKPKDIGNL